MQVAALRAIRTKLISQPLREGFVTDPDESHADYKAYRPTGLRVGRRDLTPTTHKGMIERAFDFLDTHPLAARYVSLMEEWTASESFEVSALDETGKVQEIVDAHMSDPRNDWDNQLRLYQDVMLATGMLVLPAIVNPQDGTVVYDYFDPGDVHGVDFVEGSNRVIARIYVKHPEETLATPYQVISADRDPRSDLFGHLVGEHPRKAKGKPTGVLYFRFNCRPNSAFGRSDFKAAMDYWAGLDDWHASELDGALIRSRNLGDIEYKGAGKQEIDRLKGELKDDPAYSQLFVHNEQVSVDMTPPSTNAADARDRERILRLYGSAPTGVPPHIFVGDMEQGNRAIASASNDPAYLRGKAKQRDLGNVLLRGCQYAVDSVLAVNPGALSGVEDYRLEVQAPKLLRKNPVEGAPVVAQTVLAMSQAEHQRYIDKGTARKVVIQVIGELGVEGITVAEVEEALEQEAKETPAGTFDAETRDELAQIAKEAVKRLPSLRAVE